ncbi:MAG: plasma-membrane proton-efflux P-type ATPase, partial [Nitrososphaerota archaeon]|nr:plasma-membrane proton-efflux P-type ATPase [Nitrososphaerota archaeon]
MPASNELPEYASLSHSVVAEKLGASLDRGLSDAEVKNRLEKFGFNEVEEKKTSPFVRLGKKFWGFTAWMLEITIVFSLIFRNYLDFYIIGSLLIVNALIGFAQEERASSSVEALRNKL